MESALQRPPDTPGLLRAIALTIPLFCLLATGVFILSFFLSDDGMGLAAAGMGVLTILGFIVAFHFSQCWEYRDWYLTNVVGPARAARIDLHLVLEAFEQIRASNPGVPRIKGVLGNLAMLKKLDRKRGSLNTRHNIPSDEQSK